MRRAPADALRALAEMPIAGSPPRLSPHPDRFLVALHPPSMSALTSNPHSARCPAWAQLPATSCLGAFWTPVSSACLDPRYCGRPKTCTQADVHANEVVGSNERAATARAGNGWITVNAFGAAWNPIFVTGGRQTASPAWPMVSGLPELNLTICAVLARSRVG